MEFLTININLSTNNNKMESLITEYTKLIISLLKY